MLHRSTVYRRRKKAERLGCSIDELPDMRGRHNNHATQERHPRWNGGKYITTDGYVAISVPENHHLRMANGYAYQHQIVAEEKMGRPLLVGETVHHINGIKHDNRPENIQVYSRSNHALLESKKRHRDRWGRLTDSVFPEPLRDGTGKFIGHPDKRNDQTEPPGAPSGPQNGV